jgi:glycerol kinase
MDAQYIIALDQGTTSSRSIAYNLEGQLVAQSSLEYKISYPRPGWVEQDPEDILSSQLKTLENVLKVVNPKQVLALGLTNQRETIICWNKKSGKALAPAIVWQCRRTAEYCQQLSALDISKIITAKTGLRPDAYFSATKIKWLIENNTDVNKAYLNGEAIFGTVDSWITFNLSKISGQPTFVTEASNASRTMLFNIKELRWDAELLAYFNIDPSSLCEVKPSNSKFTQVRMLGLNAPLCGILGDQQSSLLGHACTAPGETKCTFGTGAFLLQNTGNIAKSSESGLLSTIAWQIVSNKSNRVDYALEGSIFIAGALIKWLRDQLGMIKTAEEVELLARKAKENHGVIIVPAFVGLGSPYWDSSAKACIMGLGPETGREEIAYAALEAVCNQVADLLESPDLQSIPFLSIDGGMTKNNLFNQLLANVLGQTVSLANQTETTAYGAFKIAAMGAEIMDPFLSEKPLNQKFIGTADSKSLKDMRQRWKRAVDCSRGWR